MTNRICSTTVIAAVLAVFLPSCNPTGIEESASQPADGVQAPSGPMTFTCVIEDAPESKVSISDQGKNRWEPGDQILVHGEYTGEGTFRASGFGTWFAGLRPADTDYVLLIQKA